MGVIYRQGTRIVCPKCGVLVATALRDIEGGQVIRSADWDGGIAPYSVMRHCGEPYTRIREGKRQLHTSEGWR